MQLMTFISSDIKSGAYFVFCDTLAKHCSIVKFEVLNILDLKDTKKITMIDK